MGRPDEWLGGGETVGWLGGLVMVDWVASGGLLDDGVMCDR